MSGITQYLFRGRQYVVVAIGSMTHLAELVAFALPGATTDQTRADAVR